MSSGSGYSQKLLTGVNRGEDAAVQTCARGASGPEWGTMAATHQRVIRSEPVDLASAVSLGATAPEARIPRLLCKSNLSPSEASTALGWSIF